MSLKSCTRYRGCSQVSHIPPNNLDLPCVSLPISTFEVLIFNLRAFQSLAPPPSKNHMTLQVHNLHWLKVLRPRVATNPAIDVSSNPNICFWFFFLHGRLRGVFFLPRHQDVGISFQIIRHIPILTIRVPHPKYMIIMTLHPHQQSLRGRAFIYRCPLEFFFAPSLSVF